MRRPFLLDVDLDGVIFDTVAKLERQTLIKREQWTTWEDGCLNAYERNAVAECFRNRSFWSDFPLIPGAVDALWELHTAGVEIHYVTSPSIVAHGVVPMLPDSTARLEEAGVPCPEMVSHTRHKFRTRADGFIDDRPATIEKVRAYRHHNKMSADHVIQFHAVGYAENGMKWPAIVRQIKGALG